MNSFSWWKNLFTSDPPRWSRTILEAPGVEGWREAVRRWIDEESLEQHARLLSGELPMAGVPLGIKDLFDQRGMVTLAGSVLLEEIGVPAPEDALIIRRFRDLGMVPVGRTNMNEFAYGLDGFNPHTGNCPHPKDPRRISGGSSSGSAWIVGSGVIPVALGTDTGGSIRVPAALCGVYGYRGVPDDTAREGVFPLAASFDTAGWFTATREDMLALLEALIPPGEAGEREAGLLWYTPQRVSLTEEVSAACATFRRGLSHWFIEGGEARGLRRRLEAVSEESFWAYNVIGSCEAFEVHRPWFEEYRERYNPEVRRLIDRSRHWEAGELSYARRVEEKVAALLDELLSEVWGIAMPAVHRSAPLMEEVDQAFRVEIIRLTSLASLAGLPALTIPLPLPDGLSCGVQLITTERRMLSLARRVLQEESR
ncbi:MAG: amidase [Alkalispirochaetaceae bacterium]